MDTFKLSSIDGDKTKDFETKDEAKGGAAGDSVTVNFGGASQYLGLSAFIQSDGFDW